uniref:Uncharacterized protein n=1 Tax=Panagrolaimus sp. ES5 TaxID=591445 RepID=A0AC34F4E0_9BILA
MFLLGIIDIVAVFCNSLMSGYFSLVGAVYCTHPTLVYMVGVFSPSSWCGACATVLLLAFNRFMDLVSPYYSEMLFSGKRTFFWLILPGLYWFYFWFIDLPCIYSSIASACFFDPFFGVSFPRNEWEYANWGLTFNNVAIILALSGMYIAIISALIAKTRMSSAATAIQRNTILQAFLICTLCFIASAIYVCMQYLPTPSFVIILGQIFWQASHGGAVFIYLIFNKALRRGLIKLVLPEKLEKRLGNVTNLSGNNNNNNRTASGQVSQISQQSPSLVP